MSKSTNNLSNSDLCLSPTYLTPWIVVRSMYSMKHVQVVRNEVTSFDPFFSTLKLNDFKKLSMSQIAVYNTWNLWLILHQSFLHQHCFGTFFERITMK
jgi:hypothetical protein